MTDAPGGHTVDAGSAPATEPVPSSAAVAAHLEALNLAGLGFATRRMLGKDPSPVAGQFTMWARADKPGLPALTKPLWTALRPLRIGRPASPAAAVCDQVLQGRERDGHVGLRAASDCGKAGKAQFQAHPLPETPGDSRPDVLRQRALVGAIKDYWRALGGIYGEARALVVSGDHAAAVELLRRRERALRNPVEEVAVLAAAVAGAQPADVDEPEVAPQAEPPPEPVVGAEAEAQPAPDPALLHPEGLQLTDDQAEAFARHEPVATEQEEPAEEPKQVEVLSTKPVRNHPFLPIIFLLIISGVALYVLYSVVNDPSNPLLQ